MLASLFPRGDSGHCLRQLPQTVTVSFKQRSQVLAYTRLKISGCHRSGSKGTGRSAGSRSPSPLRSRACGRTEAAEAGCRSDRAATGAGGGPPHPRGALLLQFSIQQTENKPRVLCQQHQLELPRRTGPERVTRRVEPISPAESGLCSGGRAQQQACAEPRGLRVEGHVSYQKEEELKLGDKNNRSYRGMKGTLFLNLDLGSEGLH